MFQFRRFPTYDYLIHRTLSRYCRDGFPHSDISGSMLICSSPKLFAACRVLHRLLMPRHSPCALSSLTLRQSKLHILRFRVNPKALSFHCSSFAHRNHFVGLRCASSPLTSCFSELCRLHKGFFEIVSTLILIKVPHFLVCSFSLRPLLPCFSSSFPLFSFQGAERRFTPFGG